MDLYTEEFIGIIAAIIAILSALVTAFYAKRTVRAAERQRHLHYFIELRKWADECSDVLSDSSHFYTSRQPTNLKPEKAHQLKVHLSTLIDRGRWFFPNLRHIPIGQDKPLASQGHRQNVLTRLVQVYDVIDGLPYPNEDTHEEGRQIIYMARKEFISDIQAKIDPERLDREISNVS